MRRIRTSIEVLSEQELDLLHDAVLTILSEMGIRVPGEALLRLCADRGCEVDLDAQMLRIPRRVAEDYIQAMQSADTAKPGEEAMPLTGKISTQVTLTDYGAQSRRYGLRDDNLKGIRLVEHLSNIPKANAVVVPSDVPYDIADLVCVADIHKYSTKPGSTYILTPTGAKYVQMADKVVGQRTKYLFESISPLTYKADTVEIAMSVAQNGGYLTIAPMAMSSATAPVTVAGTLAIETAECLASSYLVYVMTGEHPNFSMSCHALDPRSMLCSFGSPNQALFVMATSQICRRYGIMGGCNTALTDALLPDFQGGFEKGITAALTGFSGLTGIGCQGIVGADQGFSFEQLVIDNEWLDYYNYLTRGFEVTPETIGLDTIRAVGVAGNFLGEEHTVEHMRDSYWFSTLFGRQDFANWEAEGKQTIYDRAHAVVEKATAGYREMEPVADAKKCAALDEILAEAFAEMKAREQA